MDTVKNEHARAVKAARRRSRELIRRAKRERDRKGYKGYRENLGCDLQITLEDSMNKLKWLTYQDRVAIRSEFTEACYEI